MFRYASPLCGEMNACLCIFSNGLKAMTMFICVYLWKIRRHILFDRYVHDVHILSEIYIPYVAYVAEMPKTLVVFRVFLICWMCFCKFVEAPLGEFQWILGASTWATPKIAPAKLDGWNTSLFLDSYWGGLFSGAKLLLVSGSVVPEDWWLEGRNSSALETNSKFCPEKVVVGRWLSFVGHQLVSGGRAVSET